MLRMEAARTTEESTGEHAGESSTGPSGAVELPTDLDLEDVERLARRRIGEMASAYYGGGAEDERLLAENVSAWRGWRLHPHVLVDVSTIDTSTTVLGTPMSTPILAAPTALHCLAHPLGEVATAQGVAAEGATMVLSSLSTCSLEDVAAGAPGGQRWMQVYVLRDRGRTRDLVQRAAESGYRALVLTVDAPVSGHRTRELRGGVHLPPDLSLPNLTERSTAAAHGEGGFMQVVTRHFDPSLTYDDIAWLCDLSGLPVLTKGVLRGDAALRCLESGAAGIVVSNHGGRQLDDAPPTAEALAEVVQAVGSRAPVLVDGGIRRAPDVVKALALGAAAVLVGRPVLWALGAGGPEGVSRLFAWFEAELRRTMALCGAPDVGSIDRSLVRRRNTP